MHYPSDNNNIFWLHIGGDKTFYTVQKAVHRNKVAKIKTQLKINYTDSVHGLPRLTS